MALDQSALLEVLEALKAADVDDRIRQAATTIYQALIEAELTAASAARSPSSRPAADASVATDLGPRAGPPLRRWSGVANVQPHGCRSRRE
jgi:hypothetical protein